MQRGSVGAKAESKTFKNRHGGKYDRKPFSLTIPILSRKAQIKEMTYIFLLSSATLSNPELRARKVEGMIIRM